MCIDEINKNLLKKIDGFDDKRMAMYIICCHVDKPLEEKMPESKYSIYIQAGAALTDKRIVDINDCDGLVDNISDRNQRYSEMTAMYWIGNNMCTDYVGISHYRRRFELDDKQLSDYMDEGFDIITTKPYKIPEKIEDNYRVSYYATDWNLYMEILKQNYPKYYDLARKVYSSDYIHPCNMNIFSKDMYQEYCDFVFPILDVFYQNSPWKYDTYQRRDVGFIGERLSSLFVEKKRLEGKKVIEAPFKDLRSQGWNAQMECNLSDYDKVYTACEKYFAQNNITRCRNLVAGALQNNGVRDERIKMLAILFHAALDEQRVLPETIYEYLPDAWKNSLDTLLNMFVGLVNVLISLNGGNNSEVQKMYTDFVKMTNISDIFVASVCDSLKLSNKESILEMYNECVN